jgi:hypothetical protein
MSPLRDFLYLDTSKLNSFVSQIQGGMVNEISETIRQLGGFSAGINVGLPATISGKVDASKGKESERQQTMQLTAPAYFGVLYEYLRREKELVDITELSADEIAKRAIGQFVEIKGTVEPPLVEHWIARVNTIFGFIERNLKTVEKIQGQKGKHRAVSNLSYMQVRQFKAVIDMMADYIQVSRKDPGKQYVRITIKSREYNVWCGLLPEYTTISLQSALPAEVHLFGRLERLLTENETYKIVDLSLFNQASEVDKLLQALNAFGVMIGQPAISEMDLQAAHPDIFVTPVAIFR